MKILKIVNSSDSGGVFTCEVQYLKQLKERGVQVDLIIIGSGDKLEIYKNSCHKYYCLPNMDVIFDGSIWNRIKSIISTYKYSKFQYASIIEHLSSQYDAIIYRRENFMFLAGLIGIRLKISCFWHMANSVGSPLSKWIYHFLCMMFRIIPIANSEYTKCSIGRICKFVVYPGYDYERISGGESVYRSGVKNEKGAVIFGMLSRIDKDKAIDIVIEAFVNSAGNNDNVFLLIAGGPLESEFANKIKLMVAERDNVRLIGPISDVNNFYDSIDVMINGRTNPEPFGITIAESLAVGKPVIAYYKGGPEEMIVDGQNGWLVKEPTSEHYGVAIKRAYKERGNFLCNRDKMSEDAKKFSVEVNVEKLIKIIFESN
ncbi:MULTISPECIES: glycosyltransferase family 4 protein [Sphingobacterium]|uniref:glycosyltransferase family 4 protein n=1 Tax=Sphingobacterium TaxID=28453 RepID=UPI0025808FFB|nr:MULTISPECIES: glycosyltransferase family 4 protein [Sphingobacterium]